MGRDHVSVLVGLVRRWLKPKKGRDISTGEQFYLSFKDLNSKV